MLRSEPTPPKRPLRLRRPEAPLRRVATVDLRVPIEFKVRGGRKEIILPPDAEAVPRPEPNRPLVLALARAYKWQQMLDTGEAGSLEELARRCDLDRSYVGRIVRLASLAPDIVESVVTGVEPDGMPLNIAKRPLPLLWGDQQLLFG